MYIQDISRLVDINAGGGFLGLFDQKISYKHVSDFERLDSYGHFLIPVHALVWTALTEQLAASDLSFALRAFPRDRREIFAAVATTTISPKFRVDCGKEIRVVIHTSASVLW